MVVMMMMMMLARHERCWVAGVAVAGRHSTGACTCKQRELTSFTTPCCIEGNSHIIFTVRISSPRIASRPSLSFAPAGSRSEAGGSS